MDTTPTGWITVWDKESGTARSLDPVTAKALLTADRFTTSDPNETTTEGQPESAPGDPAVVHLPPA